MLWQACFTFPDVMTLEKPLFHFLGIFEIVVIAISILFKEIDLSVKYAR